MSMANQDPWASLGVPRKLDIKPDIRELKQTDQKSSSTGNSRFLDTKTVQLEGWVEKQSRYLRSWRHRWLVLRYPKLFTFKERQVYSSPTEEIDLNGCTLIANPSWTSSLGPFGFELLTTSHVLFAFRTPTPHARDQWVSSLAQVIDTGRLPASREQGGARIVASGIPRYTGNGDHEQSPEDIEEALLRQVLRQSAIEAGIEPESVSNRVMAESTALRIQQDAEYERSLQEDMRREREEKERENGAHIPISENTVETKHKMEDATSFSASDETKNVQTYMGNDAKKAKDNENVRIPPEPEKGPETCTCQVRMPCGRRVVRRFLKSDTIETLHRYVRIEGDVQKDFNLVSNFPRKVWTDLKITLEQTKLGPKCSFFVQVSE
mmetsp:Transcript_20012/g.27875  ORF Transcript_20012/g.27875 Transcript_20012/m.27875 type:complete len:380 (-) Transcript_20012:209-1348(-)|eukprot:CAMPEP_0184482344 /NCGR_PEP_ID=MMETSP0113_2-20130426/3902_1 /TAXON_ID=91329 /ORGANISM="Norrisiella sphaerica, Strain BC52" /LENGTH=379 /DNA_ID=CAMNT_0026862013 /DNA_START=129 /DNA_END=1268 /DNA_ORIENTATION=+